MTASVAGRSVGLTFTIDRWSGILSLSGLQRGDKIVTVVATDSRGNQGQQQQAFIYDQKPVLTVLSPQPSTVARPFVYVNATCVDDDPNGCVSLKVFPGTSYNDDSFLASAKSAINRNVRSVLHFFRFAGVDSRGQITLLDRIIFPESSPQLIEIEQIGDDGTVGIFDVQDDRILYLQDSGTTTSLKVLTRSTHQTDVIPSVSLYGSTLIPQYGFLTPKGAIFVAAAENDGIYDWRDAQLEYLGSPDSLGSLKVKGNYAIWCDGTSLFLRDLVAGTNTLVAGSGVGNTDNDVAPNGDVVYWGSAYYNIFRYRGGVTTQLTNDTTFWHTYPLTDGDRVLYRKEKSGLTSIVEYGSLGEVILTPPRDNYRSPGFDYQINNGHVAFTKTGPDGALQVWVDGIQVSDFSTSSRIDFLAPGGEVSFYNVPQICLGGPGGTPISCPTKTGHNIWRGGHWLAIIGRSLFQIDLDVPSASLSTLSPASAIMGGSAFVLTVNGTNFANTATVQWSGENRPTTFVDNTRLTASILASDIAAAGDAIVTVVQVPQGGAGNDALTFTISPPDNPVPSLTSISPASARVGGPPFALTINGSNFVSSSTVQWNGSARTTVFVKDTQLIANITNTDIALVGNASVTVINPAPGGGISNALSFTVTPLPNRLDFDNDGRADILWRHAMTGQLYTWLMNGAIQKDYGSPGWVTDLGWQIKGTGDFDGDGKADILWRHNASGVIHIWFLNGTNRNSIGSVGTVSDLGWQIQQVGDFNGDGEADILWRHNTAGQVFVWLMDGVNISSSQSIGWVSDPGWQIQQIGDFNGDSKADILWRHSTTGQLFMWLMDGFGIIGYQPIGTVSDLGWQIQKVGDFNGDSKADILWRHNTAGQVFVWLMDGHQQFAVCRLGIRSGLANPASR